MPKACYECCMYQADIYYCSAAERDIDIPDSRDGRCSFCPLIPLPPHGRLGDLDELAKKIEHDRYNHTHTDGLAARHHVAEYGHFLKVISDVPTIIPATK